MVKVMYNDKLVYKAVIWLFGGYFMKREGSFKHRQNSSASKVEISLDQLSERYRPYIKSSV